MGKKDKKPKSDPFFVNVNGERRKVKPGGRKFRGDNGDVRLRKDTVVNGEPFPAGLYPFIFWDVPIYDKKDNPISNDELRVGDMSDDLLLDALFDDVKGSAPQTEGKYATYVPDSSLTTSPDRPDAHHSIPVHDSGHSSPSHHTGSHSSHDGGSSSGDGGGGSGGGGGD